MYRNFNEKYTFYQKLYRTKFVDLIEANNFALLRFFAFHILLLRKVEFWIFNSIIDIKKKNIHRMKKYCNSNL